MTQKLLEKENVWKCTLISPFVINITMMQQAIDGDKWRRSSIIFAPTDFRSHATMYFDTDAVRLLHCNESPSKRKKDVQNIYGRLRQSPAQLY